MERVADPDEVLDHRPAAGTTGVEAETGGERPGSYASVRLPRPTHTFASLCWWTRRLVHTSSAVVAPGVACGGSGVNHLRASLALLLWVDHASAEPGRESGSVPQAGTGREAHPVTTARRTSRPSTVVWSARVVVGTHSRGCTQGLQGAE